MGLSRWRLRSAERRAEQTGALIRCIVCGERFILPPHTLVAYIVSGWAGDAPPDDPVIHRIEDHLHGVESLVYVDAQGSTTPLVEAGIPPGLLPDSDVFPEE